MDTMRERFVSVTSRALDEDPRLAVVLAEITMDGFRPAQDRHPDRVINVGIREQLLIGVGGGLALTGLRPVVHTFASFLVERPFEQVKLDFGHQDMGGVLVSASAGYDWPAGGFTHMAPGDVALLDTLDGWTVHVNVLAATEGMDVSMLYAPTVRPFDDAALRAAVGHGPADVVLVEPYLAGTSTAAANQALEAVPHRVLGLGVGRAELRRYGTIDEHKAAHGLDPAALRARIAAFTPR
ncbi:transketolase [Streptomyces sp. NPDC003952]